MECGVQCVMTISPIRTLKLCAANLDIPLLTLRPIVMLSTDQETGLSGWTTLGVLAVNPVCLLVVIAAGETTTVHTARTSEFYAVSLRNRVFCLLSTNSQRRDVRVSLVREEMWGNV